MNTLLSIPADVAAILLLGIVLGEAYSYILRPLQHRYNPHWTWLTVMGGVGITWILFVVLAGRGYISWSAVWWFVAVFCLTGVGVLRWQLGQLRDHLRRERTRNGSQNAGRGRGPGSAP